jgi:hypothetical protein
MSTALHKLMDAVENAPAPYVSDDFFRDGFALLALAISKLQAEERERVLLEVECGSLRQAAALFERPSYPKPNGSGRLQ